MSYTAKQVQENLQRIEDLRVRIINLSKDVGTFHDGIHCREQIQSSVQELKQLSQTVKNEIEELKRNEGESDNSSSLHSQFEALSSKIKEALPDVIASLRQAGTPPQASQFVESTPNQSDYSKNKRPLDLMTTPLIDQATVDQETNQIDVLENEVNSILNIMREIIQFFTQTMQEITSQRNFIDSINKNTTDVAQNMIKGNEELDKAYSHQKGSRKALCIIFIIVLVIGLGIGLYFLIQYFRKKDSKKE